MTEAANTAQVLKSIDKDFDLILVERRHDEESLMLIFLSECTEMAELGAIGDLLVSSDFESMASVAGFQ